MANMKTDFVGRIKRLPEPRNAAEALQPLFEAIMNSIHSTQDKFGADVARKGRIDIDIEKNADPAQIAMTVKDNGRGLDDENYEAFLTTDTEHKKIERGGKGVGRLLWLSCFEEIKVSSVFAKDQQTHRRSFRFVLKNNDQIEDEKSEQVTKGDATGFAASFRGLKLGYSDKFPVRPANLFQHLLSHFLPVIVGSMCPHIAVVYGDDRADFPKDIEEYIVRRELVDIEYQGNPLKMEMLECDKVVSRNLQGSNFVHFIAHDRTVHTQPIDGKLGLKVFEGNLVFQALLSGEYLDSHVNQERTKFTFDDDVIEKIINECCIPKIEGFLVAPLKKVKDAQLVELSKIVQQYPSVEFASVDELSKIVPAGEIRDDQLYGTLSIHRYRRDQKQREKISTVISKLKNESLKAVSLDDLLQEASQAILETERRSLAEYIVRRRVVLTFLRELLKSARLSGSDSDYELENSLHNFICPIRVKSTQVEPVSHDLWIIDERLAFARAFSSDVPLQEVLEASKSDDRPDLLVFDNVYGLKHAGTASYVLIVEFKRPGRQAYKDDENPQFQVERYIREIRSNNSTDINGRPIRLSENTRFYCYIIADRRGKLAEWTESWSPTADGRGRVYPFQGDYKGFIELVEWDQLLDDAEERNKAFFDKAGIA